MFYLKNAFFSEIILK